MEGVTCIGSCFAGNIALKMRQSLWEAATPFGALYNPLSIAKVFHVALAKEEDRIRLINESIFEHGGILHTWLGDSSFSARSREQVTQNILRASDSLHSSLQNDRILILTFGTAWCYFLSETPDAIVANCHKLPSSKFIRRRISVEEILSVWRRLLKQLKEQFPRLEIILTVSPVRHLKDGMTGNNLSKAILHLAVEELCAEYPYLTDPAPGVYRSTVSNNIQGWAIAQTYMRCGDTAEVIVPYGVGYGASGSSAIKPYSNLRFNIRLLDIYKYELAP